MPRIEPQGGFHDDIVLHRFGYSQESDRQQKVIAYCIKTIDGRPVDAGNIAATRKALDQWGKGLPGPWIGAMEATIFNGWIYDYLTPHATELKVATRPCSKP